MALRVGACVFVLALFASSVYGAKRRSGVVFPAHEASMTDDAEDAPFVSLFAGCTNAGSKRRALLHFDLSGLPSDAAVVSATLSFWVNRGQSDTFVKVHRVQQAWSGSRLQTAESTQALPNDTTWKYASYDTTAWTKPGGVFAFESSGQATIKTPDNQQKISINGDGIKRDVESWLKTPASNHGWVLVGDESQYQTAVRVLPMGKGLLTSPLLELTIETKAPLLGVAAKFPISSVDTIDGVVVFRRPFSGAATEIGIDLRGVGDVGGFHVHELPVVLGQAPLVTLGAAAGAMTCASTMGHFNPGLVPPTSTCMPGLRGSCEVGDLSGKHGELSSLLAASSTSVVKTTLYDPELPLDGLNGIAERSLVLHSKSTGSRVACASLLALADPDSAAPYTPAQTRAAVAVYNGATGPVSGFVLFRQRAGPGFDPTSTETSVIVRLMLAEDSTPTIAPQHRWHVHTPGPDPKACTNVGPHFNPKHVCNTDECGYSSKCGSSTFAEQRQCELGDLSSKHGPVAPSSVASTLLFKDAFLPLSGPDTIVGLTLVLHGANLAQATYACAVIESEQGYNDRTDTDNGADDPTATHVTALSVIAPIVAILVFVLVGFLMYRGKRRRTVAARPSRVYSKLRGDVHDSDDEEELLPRSEVEPDAESFVIGSDEDEESETSFTTSEA